ncbi:Pycsar system effector family protein [Paenibacillus sp. FSL H7-0350]|uniref:Pycsar system effector family protein n=1 Tax=Paenibacillus sp. FSL H7-0350 TaxID=2975345 RepID=UPI0031584B18
MNNADENFQFDYHKHQSVYISDYIKFADAKAGITLSVVGVLFAFFSLEMKDLWKDGITDALHDYPFYLYLVFLLGMAAGMYFLSRVIWPRYSIDKSLYHSWGGIGAFNTSNDYVTEMKRRFQNKNAFADELMKQNHALAIICKKKYFWIYLAYKTLGISIIGAGLTWFVS